MNIINSYIRIESKIKTPCIIVFLHPVLFVIIYVHKDIYYKEVINFTIIQRIYSILTELGWMRVKYLLGEGEGRRV